MSEVLIKGMEMPKNDDMAPTAVWVYPNGYAIVFKDNGKMQQYTQVAPVPPHGRLIDADAVMSKYYDWFYSYDGERTYENMFYRLLTIIKDAPTVIEVGR